MKRDWYNNGIKATSSWCNAKALYSYVVNRGAFVVGRFAWEWNRKIGTRRPIRDYVSDVRPGDVVFYDWYGDGDMNHVSIVVANPSGYPRIDQHGFRHQVVWHLRRKENYRDYMSKSQYTNMFAVVLRPK